MLSRRAGGVGKRASSQVVVQRGPAPSGDGLTRRRTGPDILSRLPGLIGAVLNPSPPR